MITLIKNAAIVDGTGKPAYKSDLLIKGGRIAAIGAFPQKDADTVIDALGLTVTPGFIDAHSTSDHYLTIFTNPTQKDALIQGITTIIVGHCGSSLAPLLYGSLKSIRKWTNPNQINVDWTTVGEFKKSLARIRPGVNVATLVGHSTIRRDLIGEEIRDLTFAEMEILENTLRQGLTEGASGMSTGLSYVHSRHVPYSEIVNLLKTIKSGGGMYTTHLRNEHTGIGEAVEETVRIAEESGVPTIISHFRPLIGLENQFQSAMELIDQSLDKSNIYFEVNPFEISVLPIYMLLPEWAQHGGLEIMMETVRNPEHQKRILEELHAVKIDWNLLTIAEARGNPSMVGLTLKDFAKLRELDPVPALLTLMGITEMKALIFHHNINQNLLRPLLFHQRSLIGTNSPSAADSPFELKPDRATKTFPQFLQTVLAKNISLEETIKKITLVPAQVFGLQKRGAILEGWAADLIFHKDQQIVRVMVNGKTSVENEKISEERFGESL